MSYLFSHQKHLALKSHSWPCGTCEKIKVWQMYMFLEYCFPLGLHGTPTSQASTCTHIALNNFLCCDLAVTLWRRLNSPTPCCRDSQELCEERIDGAERQGAPGRWDRAKMSFWSGRKRWRSKTGQRDSPGPRHKPMRLTLTIRQEKQESWWSLQKEWNWASLPTRSGNSGKHEEDINTQMRSWERSSWDCLGQSAGKNCRQWHKPPTRACTEQCAAQKWVI